MRPLVRRTLGAAAVLALSLVGFCAWKIRAVAKELTDPPFYRPQPLARVEATYRELAAENETDPGGVWESAEVGHLQLWRLRRRKPAKGLVLLLHGFGDDRWGTSPALRWFPEQDAAIFTYLRRDDAIRAGGPAPAVTFGARESREVVQIIHHLESKGFPRRNILLMGRSLGATVGLLALAHLEREGRGPLAGFIWEGAPASSRDFGERLVRGPKDRFWHPILAPLIGDLGSRWAARIGGYARGETDILGRLEGQRLATPSLCFLATEDRLAAPAAQRRAAACFREIEVVECSTWHLNTANVLGGRYADAIKNVTARWLSHSGASGPFTRSK